MSALPAPAETVAPPVDHDDITIIRTLANIPLTKTWRDDGTIADYGSAKHFSVLSTPVRGILKLAELLEVLAKKHDCCVIRGGLAPDATPERPGLYRRNKRNFRERPLHMLMFDIDGFKPGGVDPVTQPEAAVQQFIAQKLPAEFHDVTCYWSLSASAGSATNLGKLKCHLWFWLRTPYTGGQLEAWRAGRGIDVDRVSFRTVQAHYTADPVFEAGVVNPVPVRSGILHGFISDEVPLEIPPGLIAAARDHDAGESSIDLVDPCEKPGLIGAFCRAFDVDALLATDPLCDVFEFESIGDGKRLNFLQGNGAKGGAFASPCRHYITNTHNTDPLDGRATNAWDLVRHYKFGHLDDPDDAFDQDATKSASYEAMREWAATLPEVQTELERAKEMQAVAALSAVDQLRARIVAAQTERELVGAIAADVRAEITLEPYHRETLAKALQTRLKAVTGTAVSIGVVRDLVKPERVVREVDEGFTGPRWAQDWVWISTEDKYVHRTTKIANTITSFNARHNRFRGDLTMGEESYDAHTMMSCFWAMPVVERRMYYPRAGATFDIEGISFLNEFRGELVVKPDPAWLPAGERLRTALERHLSLLIPDERERAIFRSWLAFNYLHPGVKIRWSPILKGCEGDGKSIFLDMLGLVLGAENTKSLNGDTILNNTFTGWAVGQCVAMIEEVRFQGHNRHEVANRLKPYITNNRVDLHAKGKDPRTVLNTTNYLLGTNHIDMLPLTESDRRYFVVHSPFGENAELDATLDLCYGMSKDQHFAEVFELGSANPGQLALWLAETEFHPEFQPNGNAPMTAAKRVTIEAGESETMRTARFLLERGGPGIGADVVARKHFERALRDEGVEVSTDTVSSLLTQLGFIPAAHSGRGAKPVWWQGTTVRVWVRKQCANHSHKQLSEMLDATITDAFE